MPRDLQPQQRLIEGVMTTHDEAGAINIAPMGPIVSFDEKGEFARLRLRPFKTSTTYRNLKAHGEGVFHLTDDVLLIAAAAIGKVAPHDEALRTAVQTASELNGHVLTHACRAYAFRVTSLNDRQERTAIEAEVVHVTELRPFLGFNRAMHAVLEAAILATRLHLTGADPVLAEYEALQVRVDKTGSEREHRAMALLWEFVRNQKA